MKEMMKVDEQLQKDLWKVPVELALIKDSSLTHAAFRLYLILLGYARSRTTAFPSESTLAKDLGCAERYVRELKKELKEKNLIDWKKRKGESCLYTLLHYEPITGGTVVPPSGGTVVPHPQGTTVPANNTNLNNTKNIMGQAHNRHSRSKTSSIQERFLVKFSSEYERLKGIAYTPNGAAWNALLSAQDDTLQALLSLDDYLKLPQPQNVYWKQKGLFERWLTEHQGDWEETSDKGLAILLKPDVLQRFYERHKCSVNAAKKREPASIDAELPGNECLLIRPNLKANQTPLLSTTSVRTP